jgi:hypothetical protein
VPQRAPSRPTKAAVASSDVDVHPGDIVRYVQDQLLEAQLQRESRGVLPLFEVESLELELRVCITTRKTTGGKVDMKMIAVTKDAEIEEQHVHTITLKFRTIEADDNRAAADGRRPSARKVGP